MSFLAPVIYPQGKRPFYPLYRRLGGPQRQGGRIGDNKDLLLSSGIELRFLFYPTRGLINISSTSILLKLVSQSSINMQIKIYLVKHFRRYGYL
jgi:hypothetical protein